MRVQEAREAGAAAREGDLTGRPGARAEAGCRADMAASGGVPGATRAVAGAGASPRVAELAGVPPSRTARGSTARLRMVQPSLCPTTDGQFLRSAFHVLPRHQ